MRSLFVPVLACLCLLPQAMATAQFNRFQRQAYPSYRPTQPAYGQRTINANPASSRTSLPWYANLIEKREHDFGIVARASKQRHVFEFENNTGEDLFLDGIRTSCGCTKPKILTSQVKPGEKAQVEAIFDTLNFYGQRGATVTVRLRKGGQTAELQLAVKGRIRRDVVLSPGQFEFVDVMSGDSIQQTAKVLYAGNPNWKIVDVKSTNPNITVEAQEMERVPGSGRVTYQMTVKVSNQQTGAFADTLTIFTNDARTNGMPVAVSGNIKSMIEVAPITLGVVNQGQKVTKKLIVRSAQPIAIESVETNHPKIKFEASEGKKNMHILTYTLDTTDALDIDQVITIVSNDEQVRRTEVPFSVQVVAATVTGEDSK